MGQAKLRGSFDDRKEFAIEQKKIADEKAYQEHQKLKMEYEIAKQKVRESRFEREAHQPLSDAKVAPLHRAQLQALLVAGALAILPPDRRS